MASGDESGKVLIWNLDSQSIKLEIRVNRKIVDLAWSEDGQRICAVGEGAEAFGKVFTADTGNNVGEITGHSKRILSCHFKSTRPFKIVTASEDNSIVFHQGPPFKMQSIFREHTRYPNQVRFSPNGNFFVSVGADRQIFLFDGKEGTKVKEFGLDAKDGHSASILSVSWSPDSTKLLTVSMDRSARIWDVEAGSVLRVFLLGEGVPNQQVGSLWFGKYIISVGLNGWLHYLNEDGSFKTVKGHQSNITGLSYDKTDNTLYTSDYSGQILKWNADGSQTSFHGVGDKSLLFLARNGSALTTAGSDNAIHFSSTNDLAFAHKFAALGNLPTKLAVSHSGEITAVSLLSKQLQLFKGELFLCSQNVDFDIGALAFSHDDKELAVGGGDNKVYFYSIADGALSLIASVDRHDGAVTAISYFPDDSRIVTCGKDRLIYFWDRATRQLQNDGWQIHTGMITDVAFAGNKLITTSLDQSVIVWNDLDNKNKRQQLLLAHIGGVDRVDVISDSVIVTTGADRAIRAWQLA